MRLLHEAGEARREQRRDRPQKREVAAAAAAVWESADSRGGLESLQGSLDLIEKLLLEECTGRGSLAASESGAGPRGAGAPGLDMWTKTPLEAEVLLGRFRGAKGPTAGASFGATETALGSDCMLRLTQSHELRVSRRAPGSAAARESRAPPPSLPE